MEEIVVPPYFICPISLHIMKDPVTALTGITYDRESIEHWFLTSQHAIFCPITKQPLSRQSELTPNHTLRRLINSWLALNDASADRVLTPKPPLDKNRVRNLVRDLSASDEFRLTAIKKLEALTVESEKNRTCMEEVGVAKEMILFIIRCFKEDKIAGLEEALRILSLLRIPDSETWFLSHDNNELIINSLTWVFGLEIENHIILKSYAIEVLKMAIEVATSYMLEQLKFELFKNITKLLNAKVSNSALKSTLKILIKACPCGRNRIKIVEAGVVFELITLELEKPEKNISELIFNLLAHLCSSADGRAELLRHAGGIAVVSKRILRVSAATSDRAIHILSLICKNSARNKVLQEMLRVGAVSKLCMVLQSDCDIYLRGKAREILRMHSNVWNNSPCIDVYLMTRDPR